VKTILVADDNRRIREFCQRELEGCGYRVILARDGREAVELITEQHPDLAILDIVMPRMDGLEAIARLMWLRPDMPVLLLTALNLECLNDPRARLAAACINKGDDFKELRRAVGRALEASTGHQRLCAGLPRLSS
jgi:two-component system response regulator (stage 0 sporulation protein F)